MPMLFCNVGWMDYYSGIVGDFIERGGTYNKHSVGHEVCNFTENDGTLYGYVQPVKPTGQIKIERLGAGKNEDSVSGVTVVWTAGPPSGGTVVVGWYKDATVYRGLQNLKKPTKLQKNNGVLTYRIKALACNAELLPVERRQLIIPRAVKGGIGQSNVWFAAAKESRALVQRVAALIKTGTLFPLPDIDLNQSIYEGNPRLQAHLRRERNPRIIKTKKTATLRATGKLCCEVCSFDFKDTYGERGDGFCEVHHLLPLSKADGEVKTTLDDLAIVCSNCHRIIHRTVPMPSISSLSKHVIKHAS